MISIRSAFLFFAVVGVAAANSAAKPAQDLFGRLQAEYENAEPALKSDLLGYYSGRCVFHDARNEEIATLLIGWPLESGRFKNFMEYPNRELGEELPPDYYDTLDAALEKAIENFIANDPYDPGPYTRRQGKDWVSDWEDVDGLGRYVFRKSGDAVIATKTGFDDEPEIPFILFCKYHLRLSR